MTLIFLIAGIFSQVYFFHFIGFWSHSVKTNVFLHQTSTSSYRKNNATPIVTNIYTYVFDLLTRNCINCVVQWSFEITTEDKNSWRFVSLECVKMPKFLTHLKKRTIRIVKLAPNTTCQTNQILNVFHYLNNLKFKSGSRTC